MTTGILSLPPQMISFNEKNERWKKDCMDALESIGRSQISQNDKLVENYEMIKGKFIYSHYIDREDYQDFISQLTQEFSIPSHLKHYDIISQVINTLSGEYQKRPALFKAIDCSEKAKNNYIREKTQLLLKYVQSTVNEFIQNSLFSEGLDPQKQDFNSQEEAQEYQSIIQQRTKELTPPEIQKFMDLDWQDVAEMWAAHQIHIDNHKFNRKEVNRIAFEDMCASDTAFKHFYLTPTGHNEELWNPINTFFHKSPEITNLEYGDYIGRVFYLTIPEIINRYGYKMTEDQILDLERFKRDTYKNKKGNSTGDGSPSVTSTLQANTVVPFESYGPQKFATTYLGTDPNNPINVDNRILHALGDNTYNHYGYGMFQVTEAYWMSQKKIGKFVYWDSEKEESKTILVDENFNHKLIPGIKILESSFIDFDEENEVGTLTWTWVNEVWTGIKINTSGLNIQDSIYIGIEPNKYQFKGDLNIYGAKLPVCGQIFNNRNGESMSLADLMKPHQIGHNVAMNQLYEIMQREIGRFMLMDTKFIPSSKDWGGEGNFERLMMVAKQLGIAPLDGSPSNTGGSSFAHFQMIDLDESSRMLSRMNIADYFKNAALSQVGITPQRLGIVSASETATGIEQAQTQSFAQTDSYFTRFADFERRCLQMSLDIALYCQSQEDDLTIMNLKSDVSRGFIKIKGSDLSSADLGLYIMDSQELIRQLETMRSLFLNNNTIGATPVDLVTVIQSNSPSEIKKQMETSYRLAQEQQQAQSDQQNQLKQQEIEAYQQAEQMRIMKEDERLDKTLANQRYIAELNASAKLGSDTVDNSNLEIDKFNAEIGIKSQEALAKEREQSNKALENLSKQKTEQQKISLENKRLSQEKELKEKEFKLKEKEMENALKIAKYADKGTKNSPK